MGTETSLPLNASTQLALGAQSFPGKMSTPPHLAHVLNLCAGQSITGAKKAMWAAGSSGCAHEIGAWPISGGNKGG